MAITLLIEAVDGAIEVRRFPTRISAVLALEEEKTERVQRLTIIEDGKAIYSVHHVEGRWREDPLVG